MKTGEIISLPFEDDTFDAVFDSEAVYVNTWEESRKIYQEMYRVAKPGGKLLVITFADDCAGNQQPENARELKTVSEGPLSYGRVARFTSYDDIAELIAPWRVQSVDKNYYSEKGWKEGLIVSEWIVSAEK